MFLTAPNLSSLSSVSHGFFTRSGGVSGGIYASLNCGIGTRDDADKVLENRSRIAASLGTQSGHLLTLYQTHSADVITVDTKWGLDDRPHADAMVTRKRGLALGIMTADCVPVLLADRKNGVIGAVHSGWKGALAHIGVRTIEAMLRLGAAPDSIVVAVGPAIAQQSYEVDSAFRQNFIRQDTAYMDYFMPALREGHWMFDLKRLVRDDLAAFGIKDINMLENDTYIEEDAFFSFRRATHRKEADYGRQISAIMLNM